MLTPVSRGEGGKCRDDKGLNRETQTAKRKVLLINSAPFKGRAQGQVLQKV